MVAISQFVPFKRIGGIISTKISGDTLKVDGELYGDTITDQFVNTLASKILNILTDPRLLVLWTGTPGSGTTEPDLSSLGHDGTYVVGSSWTSADKLNKGFGWTLDFDGTDDYLNFGDSDDFSFGDGSNDSPVSWFGVIEVVADAAAQIIISKTDQTTGTELREWKIQLWGSEALALHQYDESANVWCYRLTDAALSNGWHTFCVTSSGDGGATAMNNVKIYIDGTLVASTATNNASYVAMENLATPVLIGAEEDTGGSPGSFFQSDMGCIGITAEELAAYDIWKLHLLLKHAYNI